MIHFAQFLVSFERRQEKYGGEERDVLEGDDDGSYAQ